MYKQCTYYRIARHYQGSYFRNSPQPLSIQSDTGSGYDQSSTMPSSAPTTGENAALQLVGMRALLLTKGTSAAIALGDHESMVCEASIGRSAPPVGCRLDVSSGFSGECVRTAEALRCDDAENDPRVDAESCSLLGIRSILAAPILSGNKVVGLLEVLSPELRAFDDGCLSLIARLAQSALPAPSACTPPNFLVEMEPAHRVFFRNLSETLFPPRLAPLKRTSLPARFWGDVFVPSQLPWRRFFQSLAAQALMTAALVAAVELGAFQASSVRPQTVDRADVVYYSPSEYARALHAGTGSAPSMRQAALVVPRGSRERETVPPEVRVKAEIRSIDLLLSGHSVFPAPPTVASSELRLGPGLALIAVVAPPPQLTYAAGRRSVGGLGGSAVVGPPPEALGVTGRRTLAAPAVGVVEPPPAVSQVSGRSGGMQIGHVEAVGPAPQISSQEAPMRASVVRASLNAPLTAIAPPHGSAGVPPATMRVASSNTDPMARDPRATNAPAAETREQPAQTKEVSVNFVGLALSLPSSSYFASHEVFIAEERTRSQSRLIKLVYEFLPYQERLSDYGPDYPDVDKLRVTRDPSCDESLPQVMTAMTKSSHAVTDRLQQHLSGVNVQAGKLECYRTTADDYRRARSRRH